MTEFSSTSITNLAKALLKAQEQMRPVQKDAVNPFWRNKYATLSAVLDVVRKPLLDNGVLLVQRCVESEPGTAAVESRLIHSSGEWIASTTTIPLPDADPGTKSANAGQAVGAAISYARRYGLMAMLSLAAVDEDTDNEVRQPQSQPRFQPPQARQQEQPAPVSNGKEKAEYPGLPTFPNVSYEEALGENGQHIVIAKGATLVHKDGLKRAGFRWSPERKAWWIAA